MMIEQDFYQRTDAYLRYSGKLTFAGESLPQLLAEGKYADALAILDRNISRDEISKLCLIRAELLCLLGRNAEAHDECLRILRGYEDDPDVWSLLAWIELRQGRPGQAEPFCKRALRIDPSHVPSRVNTAFVGGNTAQGVATDAAGLRVCIMTSIPPKRFEATRRCLSTWIKGGFEVMSLNPAEELPVLEAEFPEVRFVKAERDGRKHHQKPLVYIEDMLRALAEGGADICGIVNADIAFCHQGDFRAFVVAEAKGGMLFGPRVELPTPEARIASLYLRGFDYFFFDRSVIPDMGDSGFCVGVPWWDIYFPFLFMLQGIRVKMNVSPVAYHLAHDTNWSVLDFYRMGMRFLQLTDKVYDVKNATGLMASLNVMNFGAHIMSQAKLSAEALFRRSEPVYYADPLFREVIVPVDPARHLSFIYMPIVLASGQPSAYERIVGGKV